MEGADSGAHKILHSMKPDGRANHRFWVLQQHETFSVLEGDSLPATETQKGERAKVAHGPYPSEAAALEAASKLQARTFSHFEKHGHQKPVTK